MKHYTFLMMMGALALVSCKDKELNLRIEALERKNARLAEAKDGKGSADDMMIDHGPKKQPAGVTLHARLFEQQTFGNLIVTNLKLIKATPEDSRSEDFQTTVGVVRFYVAQFKHARGEISAQYDMVAKDATTHPDRLKAIEYLLSDLDTINVRISDLEHVLPRQ